MKLTEKVYFLPFDSSSYLLYAPLSRILSRVNQDVVDLMKYYEQNADQSEYLLSIEKFRDFFEFLRSNGLIGESELPIPSEPSANVFPTKLILIPTYDCNLRCVYCYANSGSLPIQEMPIEVAKSAVNTVFINAQMLQKKSVSVSFHGGGEPTRAWNLLVDVVKFARSLSEERNIELNLHITTNGVLNRKQCDWLMANKIHVQVSIDGPSDLQNLQRPMATGKGSFDYVLRTISLFEKMDHPYGIQSVITSAGLHRMCEIVDFFHSITSLRDFHFEPLFECGRCIYSGWQEPDPNEFVSEFFEAWQYALTLGIKLHTSLSRLSVQSIYCGAAGQNFIITPEGNVTSCLEVTRNNDPKSNVFLYGFFDKLKMSFDINKDSLSYLASRNVHNMDNCKTCFISWNCAGDCLVKALSNGNMFDPYSSPRCQIAKSLMLKQFKSILESKEIADKLGMLVL